MALPPTTPGVYSIPCMVLAKLWANICIAWAFSVGVRESSCGSNSFSVIVDRGFGCWDCRIYIIAIELFTGKNKQVTDLPLGGAGLWDCSLQASIVGETHPYKLYHLRLFLNDLTFLGRRERRVREERDESFWYNANGFDITNSRCPMPQAPYPIIN